MHLFIAYFCRSRFLRLSFFARETLCELETEIITVTHDNKLLKRGYRLVFR